MGIRQKTPNLKPLQLNQLYSILILKLFFYNSLQSKCFLLPLNIILFQKFQ